MKIKKIEWKNIFSYGNKEESMVFDEGGSLWQLCGMSGSGKSSVIQLPFLVLFGETISDVKLASIPNRNNVKGSMVRGTIMCGDTEYVITRTFKPHTIEITKNGERIDLPGIDSKQDYIQSEILCGLTKNIFKNILNLSLNSNVSFIDMGAKDKRSIVDFLLDMEILNYYTELVGTDTKNVSASFNEANGSRMTLDKSLADARAKVAEKKTALDKANVNLSVEEINNLESRIAIGNKKKNDVELLLKQKQSEFGEKNVAKNAKWNEIASIDKDLSILSKQIELYNKDKCPTCGASFTTDEFSYLKDKLNGEYNDLTKRREEKVNEYNTAAEEYNKVLSDIQQLQQAQTVVVNKIVELTNSVSSAKDYVHAKDTYDSAIADVERLESEVKSKTAEIGETNRRVELLNMLKTVYSDKGVKKVLREKYIPELNREINASLERMNVPYRMEFDNDFSAVLYDRGEAVQIETLSGGEKQRANMAVLYSMVKIVKNKYPSINVIALDETTSHIDPENGMDVFKFFKDISRELNLNIIIVTHNEVPDDSVFDHRWFMKKVGGYSEITKM